MVSQNSMKEGLSEEIGVVEDEDLLEEFEVEEAEEDTTLILIKFLTLNSKKVPHNS